MDTIDKLRARKAVIDHLNGSYDPDEIFEHYGLEKGRKICYTVFFLGSIHPESGQRDYCVVAGGKLIATYGYNPDGSLRYLSPFRSVPGDEAPWADEVRTLSDMKLVGKINLAEWIEEMVFGK